MCVYVMIHCVVLCFVDGLHVEFVAGTVQHMSPDASVQLCQEWNLSEVRLQKRPGLLLHSACCTG